MNELKVTIVFFLFLVFVPIVSTSGSGAETMTCTDKLGRVVHIPIPVKRPVFFLTYELVPAMDIWDKVVGLGRWACSNDLMKAVRPDIDRSFPSVGSGSDINIEALLKLKPDLIVTWTFKPEMVKFMEQKGLRVIAVYPESLEELYEVMRLHGRLFQREKRMESAISQMEIVFNLIKQRVSKIPAQKRRRVLWLGGKQTTVACGIGVTNDIIRMIGGINPAAGIRQRNADVSMEQIVAWKPDVVFIWGNAGYGASDIMTSPQWRSVRAVKDRRVHKAPEWSTWSPRLAPIALWMAAKTYPECFKDQCVEKVADDFYRKVFGISYKKVKPLE